jgi:predicted kinase
MMAQLAEDVHKLRSSLGELPEPVARPVLVLVSGLPGTGKSYFCRKLAEKVPLLVLESDRLRKLLFRRPGYSRDESARLFKAIHELLRGLLQSGMNVVLDATNLEEHHRERLYHIVDQLNVRLIIVRLKAPAEVVQERLQGRAVGLDPSDHSEADWVVYRKMKPFADPIRRSHFQVDTSKDITPALDKITHMIDR